VTSLEVYALSFGSTLQIGDSTYINGLTRAIAVQRDADIFFGDEGDFSKYPIFSEPIPFLPIEEELTYESHNYNPNIKVNNIHVLGISTSSALHIGNTEHVSLESRVKHIRQLSSPDERYE
jgi:spore germination protein PE